jgi:tetratricopeptide (TPR) repeat protein
MIVAVGGVTGSRRDGLAELERVARSNGKTADDARVILSGLYVREDRLEDSLKMLEELRAKYPSNFVVRLEEANTLVKLKRNDEAFAAFDELLESPRVRSSARDYVEYSYAEALKGAGRFEAALAHYAEAWAWKGADPDVVTLARLGAGQCHDALKHRAEALAQYKIVLARPDVLDSRKKAERFTKAPYSPSSPIASTGQLPIAS